MCISTAVVASAFPLCMVFIKNMLRGKPGLGMSSIVIVILLMMHQCEVEHTKLFDIVSEHVA